MRKFLYTVGLATVILLNATVVKASNDVYYTNYNNLEMSEQQYNNLLNQGFTEAQINRMDEDEFNANKDIEATLVSQKRTFVKTRTMLINGIKYTTSAILDEDTYREEVSQAREPNNRFIPGSYYDGDYWDNYYEMLVHITNLSDYQFRYKMDVYWDTIPTDKYVDVMGIGIEQDKVYMSNSPIFREDWETYSNDFYYTTSCYPKMEDTGGSVMFELPSISASSIKNLSQYMYFNIEKYPNVGTITLLEAAGGYAHAVSYYDPNATDGVFDHYSVDITGIYFDNPYRMGYRIVAPVSAIFVGTWN